MKYDPKLLAVAAAALLFTIGAVAFGLSLKNPGPSAQPAVAPAPPEAKNNAEAVFAPDKVASVKTEEVAYFGETKGFYARPDDGNTYPGVVMIHEWWGLNDAIKTMARHLAGQGYAVLAVDLYDGKVGGTPDEARVLVSTFDPERGLENMRAAQAYLRTHGSTKIASLGWCFGGGQSLQMALAEPLDATVLYYGTPLVTDEDKLKAIDWPVLGIFGEKDAAIPLEQVQTFEGALIKLDIPHQIRIYPGVGHAFANPSGASFAPDATRDAWNRTLDFLEANL